MPDLDRYMTHGDVASELTRAELAMIRALEAFSRWSVFLNKAVSETSLSHQDIAIMHSIRMRGGPQNLSELLLFLNRNDVSSIQYSLKKLERYDLVERVVGNSKREAGHALTKYGEEVTGSYAELRERLLVKIVSEQVGIAEALHRSAETLERMTGIYDQATQTVLNRKILARNPLPGESEPR